MRDVAGYQVGWVEGNVLISRGGGDPAATLIPAKSGMICEAQRTGLQPNTGASQTATRETRTQDARVGLDFSREIDEQSTASELFLDELVVKKPAALVGSLKLSDSRLALAAAGCATEFRGGALMCTGDKVRVRKTVNVMGAENLLLEGNLCDTFFSVRSTLYHHHQV